MPASPSWPNRFEISGTSMRSIRYVLNRRFFTFTLAALAAISIFHCDRTADRSEMALGIEADRMRNLKIDERHEFQQEKGAVIAELSRDEDQPWDLEQKAILPLLFESKNPYGHPVIGQRKHVEAATAAIITAHYAKCNHPNNPAL